MPAKPKLVSTGLQLLNIREQLLHALMHSMRTGCGNGGDRARLGGEERWVEGDLLTEGKVLRDECRMWTQGSPQNT